MEENYGHFLWFADPNRICGVTSSSNEGVDLNRLLAKGEKQKKYYLDHFGDSLLDKRSNFPYESFMDKGSPYENEKEKRYFLDHFGDSLLDKKSLDERKSEKRYYLDHFGDSLLDKRRQQRA